MILLTGPLTCVITGVVRKLLYATFPVRRRTRGQLVGWTVTTWICAICSLGTVNSSVLPAPELPLAYVLAPGSLPAHAASIMVSARAGSAAARGSRGT